MEYAKIIDLIKQRVDIVNIISEHVSLVKSGAFYKGLCPFHAERTPSFTITPSQGLFYCFGCKKGGDVVKFLMDIEKLDYNDAVDSLCTKIGIEYDSATRSMGIKRKIHDKALISEIYNLNAKIY
nr:CHC2 zinc finger domain-containing protein [Borrelia crocidurae]